MNAVETVRRWARGSRVAAPDPDDQQSAQDPKYPTRGTPHRSTALMALGRRTLGEKRTGLPPRSNRVGSRRSRRANRRFASGASPHASSYSRRNSSTSFLSNGSISQRSFHRRTSVQRAQDLH